MKTIDYTKILVNSASVWRHLCTSGGIRLQDYDIELEKEIQQILGFPMSLKLEPQLKKSSVSVEDFLRAFFLAIRPYTAMWGDLLHFFEEAGASTGDHNIRIRFDCEQDVSAWEFDLNNFRQWHVQSRRVVSHLPARHWNHNTLWMLNSAVRDMNARPASNTLNHWYNYYDAPEKKWTTPLPQAPIAGVSQLDEILADMWRVWTAVVLASMAFGEKRADLERAGRADSPFASESTNRITDEAADWQPSLLFSLDHDNWAGSLATGAYWHAEQIRDLSNLMQDAAAKTLESKIREVLKYVPTENAKFEGTIQELDEFLSLPLWEKRHELYSAWVSTQVANALREYDFRIQHRDGVLRFPFKKTTIAVVERLSPRLHLFAEMRHSLTKPRGKGRKKGAQPDYTLASEPLDDVDAPLLLIECKQYKKSSVENFSVALEDYARATNRATVILVNYGPVSAKVVDSVDKMYRARVVAIEHFQPENHEALRVFCELVRSEALRESKPVMGAAQVEAPSVPAEYDKLSLEWNSAPVDIDLHLNINEDNANWTVNYQNKGTVDTEPWAELDRDVTARPGHETIVVRRWLEGTYHCYVHNYSNDRDLAGCDATVSITLNGITQIFFCPENGNGLYWHVFNYDYSKRSIETVNRIVDHPM